MCNVTCRNVWPLLFRLLYLPPSLPPWWLFPPAMLYHHAIPYYTVPYHGHSTPPDAPAGLQYIQHIVFFRFSRLLAILSHLLYDQLQMFVECDAVWPTCGGGPARETMFLPRSYCRCSVVVDTVARLPGCACGCSSSSSGTCRLPDGRPRCSGCGISGADGRRGWGGVQEQEEEEKEEGGRPKNKSQWRFVFDESCVFQGDFELQRQQRFSGGRGLLFGPFGSSCYIRTYRITNPVE